MFAKEVYVNRRKALLERMRLSGESGILLFIGNIDVPSQGSEECNGYDFRQDSHWLYFFGLDLPRWAGIMDLDSGETTAFADDLDIEDIIWTGPQPRVSELAATVGISRTGAYYGFDAAVKKALSEGRHVHFLPPLRYFNMMRLCQVTGYNFDEVRSLAPGFGRHASEAFVKAVISIRLVKEECEIAELDKACDLGYQAHVAGRDAIKVGASEAEAAAAMNAVLGSLGWGKSFSLILSQHGETLHNHVHDKIIEAGRLLLIDAGIESFAHYPSDHTRTSPNYEY